MIRKIWLRSIDNKYSVSKTLVYDEKDVFANLKVLAEDDVELACRYLEKLSQYLQN